MIFDNNSLSKLDILAFTLLNFPVATSFFSFGEWKEVKFKSDIVKLKHQRKWLSVKFLVET